MKTTDLEIMHETPSQPARITRRSFVKRTSSTILLTALALHAFRNEAFAANAGSSSSGRDTVKLTAWPPCVALSESIMQIDNQEKWSTGNWEGKTVSIYTKGEVSPDYIEPTTASDGTKNYLYNSFSIVFSFTVTIRNGTSVIYNGSGTLSSSLGATRGGDDKITGYASPLDDELPAMQTANLHKLPIPNTPLLLVIALSGKNGTSNPPDESASPYMRCLCEVWAPNPAHPAEGHIIIVCSSGLQDYQFTFAKCHLP